MKEPLLQRFVPYLGLVALVCVGLLMFWTTRSSKHAAYFASGPPRGKATVVYRQPLGMDREEVTEEVSLPWSGKVLYTKDNPLAISVTNLSATGMVTCTIVLDDETKPAQQDSDPKQADCSMFAP